MKKYIYLLMLTFALFIIVGCSNNDNNKVEEKSNENNQVENEDSANVEETSESDNNETTASEESNSTEDNSNSEENEATENDSSDDNNSVADENLPDKIEVNEEQKHANSVDLEVEEIIFKDDHITMTFNAQNNSDSQISLAYSGDGLKLEDDKGNNYRYVADEENGTIKVGELEKVTGKVNFLGKIAKDAESLTLTFNPDYGGEDKKASFPLFTFKDIEIKR